MSSFARDRGLPRGLLLAGILVMAANLRPVITAVGPVLPLIGNELGLSASALGTLAAVPIVAFGVVSPIVHSLGRRFGVEQTVLVALILLAAGTVIRSLPGQSVTLWVGTALIGATVAVGNVLMPVVVKRDFPMHLTGATAGYTAAQSVFAALASGLAVPIATAWGSWRLALGVWALLMVVALVLWLPRLGRPGRRPAPILGSDAPGFDAPPSNLPPSNAGPIHLPRVTEPSPLSTTTPTTGAPPVGGPPHSQSPPVSVWRSGLAWQVAAFMGLQSMIFYTLVNWLPTMEQDLGVDPATAGWHLFLFQAVGIVSNLAAPSLMRIGGNQRFAAVTVPSCTFVAVVGMTLLPSLLPLWIVLVGLGTGGAFVIALSLVGLRSADPATTSKLSSMSQSVGYLLAAAGLMAAGALRDLTGPGPLLFVGIGAVAALQVLTGSRVGRNRVIRA
ncbi:MAG: MFS transporter [Georgenia sp.]